MSLSDSAGSDLLVDIDEVIRSKSKRLHTMLPGFVIRYLKRILHQDEINSFISRHQHINGLPFAKAILEDYNLGYTLKNRENIPASGRFVFASNHPLGGFDGVALVVSVGEMFNGKVKIVANDLLMNIKNLHPVFVGVNKHGMTPRDSIREFNAKMASDEQIIIFPAGLISRRKRGKVRDLEWHKSFIKKAIQFKRDIIPVFVSGCVSGFFYRLANIRSFLRMKTNIEMLYLVDEMYKQLNSNITIAFGKPISYTTFDKSRTMDEWIQYVRQKVYEMSD